MLGFPWWIELYRLFELAAKSSTSLSHRSIVCRRTIRSVRSVSVQDRRQLVVWSTSETSHSDVLRQTTRLLRHSRLCALSFARLDFSSLRCLSSSTISEPLALLLWPMDVLGVAVALCGSDVIREHLVLEESDRHGWSDEFTVGRDDPSTKSFVETRAILRLELLVSVWCSTGDTSRLCLLLWRLLDFGLGTCLW